jgi:hypothetical protein
MSDDQPFFAPNRPPAPPRTPRPTEHLWAIRRNGRQYDGELLNHGTWGVEFQVLYELAWLQGTDGRHANWRSPRPTTGRSSHLAPQCDIRERHSHHPIRTPASRRYAAFLARQMRGDHLPTLAMSAVRPAMDDARNHHARRQNPVDGVPGRAAETPEEAVTKRNVAELLVIVGAGMFVFGLTGFTGGLDGEWRVKFAEWDTNSRIMVPWGRCSWLAGCTSGGNLRSE